MEVLYLLSYIGTNGAVDETRTRNLRDGNAMLYQLSYCRNGGRNRARTCDPLLVRQVLSQLSYSPLFEDFWLAPPDNFKLYQQVPQKSTLLHAFFSPFFS